MRISYVLGGLSKGVPLPRRGRPRRENAQLGAIPTGRQRPPAEAYDDARFWAGVGERFEKPLGLNETKEVLLDHASPPVPVRKTYTCDPVQFRLSGSELRISLTCRCTTWSRMPAVPGREPLPEGKARIFQGDGQGGSAFFSARIAAPSPTRRRMGTLSGLYDIGVGAPWIATSASASPAICIRHEVTLKYRDRKLQGTRRLRWISPKACARFAMTFAATNGRDPEWQLGDGTLRQPDPGKSDADQPLFHVDLPARTADGQAKKQIHTLRLTLNNEW